MKYVKACDILPQYLLEEIQNYAEGCMIYIPNKFGNRKAWGDTTGARYELNKRNLNIKKAFKNGTEIEKLSKKYCLTVETIKKIVYSK